MSKTIDERIVEMRFDNAQFERGVSQTMSSVEKLKRGLKMDGVSKGFGILDRSVNAVCSSFSALEVMGVTAVANITNSAVNAGKRIVKALTIDPVKSGFQEYETQINAVQTILANTSRQGTTLEQVNKALDELNHYADLTIYNFTEMTRNIGTFTAAGVDLETSVAAIKGIANLAAVSGSTSQQASTAMYQLSQALAAGTVKLQDWNSVVNAGMGGQVFQDALKETARVHGIAIDKMIADEGSFRETLQKGWLSSDILTETLEKFTGDLTRAQLLEKGYTEEQTRAILEMGQTANDAATKVKTFTQLIDTLKEAAQSGWTQTWETIVGDFEEAKSLWTGISDRLSEMINASANARNKVLAGGLESGWSRFLKEGVTDAVAFKEAVTEAAEAHGVSVAELIENTSSFEESLSSGWLNADILGEALDHLTAKTSGLSDEELAAQGITREQAEALEKLNQSAKDGTVDLKKYSEEMGRLSGRENLIASFWNAWDGLFAVPKEAGDAIGVITALQESFREIFPRTTSEQVYQLTARLKEFTENFKMSEETAKNVKNTFKGVFAVVDMGRQAFAAMGKAVSPLVGELRDLGGGLLGLTGSLGEWLAGMNEWIKKNDLFGTAAGKIAEGLKTAANEIRSFAAAIGENFDFSPFALFDGVMGRLGVRMDQVRSAADGVSGAIADSGLLSMLQALVLRARDLGTALGKGLGALTNGLAGKIKNSDFSGLLDLLTGVSLSGIGLSVAKFINNAGEPLKNVGEILDSVKGSLEAFQTQLKAGALLKIAAAMGVLTASIVALSLVDSGKLAGSLGAMAVMFGELVASLAVLEKLNGSAKSMTKTYAGLIAMSSAVLILSGAVRTLAELDMAGLIKGLTGVGVLLSEIGIFLNLANFEGKTFATGAGLLVLSGAIKILASACKDFGGMDPESMVKGLAGVGAVLGEMALFTNFRGNSKGIISTGLGLIELSAAMKIFASAVSDFGAMSPETIGTGLLAMGAALAEVAIAANLMPKNLLGTGAGLIAVGGALAIVSGVLAKLGSMSGGQTAAALIAVGGALAELTVALNLMKGTLAGAAALSVASTALLALTPALVLLGGMSGEGIAKALISLAGAFGIFGAAGYLLAPVTPVLLTISGAVSLLAVSIATLLAAMAALNVTTPLADLTAPFGALGGLLKLEVLKGAFALIPQLLVGIISSIKDVLIALCDAVAQASPALGDALIALVTTAAAVVIECAPDIANALLALITSAVGALATYTPQIMSSLMTFLSGVLESLAANLPTLIPAAANALGAFFEGIFNALGGMDLGTLAKVIAGAGIFAVVLTALGSLAGLVPGAMAGVLGLGVVIGELALVLAAVGALAQIPGLSWLIGEGGNLLGTIGTAIGSFFGGIAGGFMGGVSSQFPQIGADLSAFMTNLEPFISGAERMDSGAMAGVTSLVTAILALTGAELLQGITSWITGGSSIAKFAEELIPFGEAMAAYSEAVSGKVDPNAVTASANAAKVLTELERSLPKSGGLVGLLTGNKDISAFGKALSEFATEFRPFYDEMTGIEAGKITPVIESIQALTQIAKDTQTLDTWGLREFGASLAAMASMGIDNFIAAFDGAEAAVKEAGKSLAINAEDGLRPAISNLQNAGKDAAQGLINGLRSKLAEVTAAGRALGNAAERGTRDALQTHSPGKAHMAAGEDAGDGTVLGLEKSVPKVAEAGKHVGEAALGGIKDLGSSAMAEMDKWLGKTKEAGKAAEETAAKETKAAGESAKAVQKSAKAKTKAVKSSYEAFTEYIEEERYYNRLTTEEELEQYKKVQKAYRLSAEERKKVNREVYRLEKELREEAYQHSMGWIEEEKYYKRLSLEEELAAYERVQARHEQGTDEWKKLEREKFRVQNELQEEAYQNSLDWIEEEKYYKRLSLEEELAAWERVQARYLQGSEERKKADREVYRLRNEIADKQYQDTLDWIDEQKGFDRLGLAGELAAYRKLQKQYINDTEKRKKVDKSVYDIQKQLWQAQKDYYADVEKAQNDYHQKRLDMEEEYAEKVRSVNEQLQRDIQAANERYESAVESRSKSLYGSWGLFDEVGEKDDVDGSKLMANLEDQVKEFSQWQEALRQLGERGVDKDLLAELEEMGPSAIKEIEALVKLSDGELTKYVSLWSIKHAMARKQAVGELEGLRTETEQEIAELQNSAARELEEYRRVWSEQMSRLESDTAKQLEDLKTSFEKTVGLLPEYTEQEFTEMVTTANDILRKGGWTEIGEAIVESLTLGVENKKIDFIDVMAGLAKAGAEAAQTGNGFAMTHGKTLGYASNLISNALSEDVQPVIRPVLDLTDVERGMGSLNNTFALSHTSQIQNAPRTGGANAPAADLQDAARAMNAGNDRVVGAIAGLRSDVVEMGRQMSNMQMVLDSGALIGELSGPMDDALGRRAVRRGRGM